MACFVLTAVGAAQAATVLSTGFESGAGAWNLTTGTSPATIYTGGTFASTGSNALRLQTGSPYQIGQTPTLDLTGATLATIAFDYKWDVTANNATRFFSVDFWNGTSWVGLSPNITATVTPTAVSLSYNVASGFNAGNMFRFEGKNSGGGGTLSAYIDNVVITANVPEPEIAVSGNSVNIVDGDATPSLADFTDFGSTAVGVPIQRTFRVDNTGPGTLATSSLTLPSGFSIFEGLSASIAASGFDTFTVQFDAPAPGVYSGDISFTNNDSDENPFTNPSINK